MLNDDNEYAACVNSSVQKLQQWLTKCKWKCENDHNRGTGNVEALEQKKKNAAKWRVSTKTLPLTHWDMLWLYGHIKRWFASGI